MTSALQALYVALGIGINLLSMAHRMRTGKLYTPVNPWLGLATMALYAGASTLHAMGLQVGTAGLVFMLVVIVHGGILRHLNPSSTTAYASTTTRWAAIAINGFGAMIATVALATSGTP